MFSTGADLPPTSHSKLRSRLFIQSVIIKAIHDFFEEEGFIQIPPISITRLSSNFDNTEESKDLIIKYYGQNLRLTKSMVLHNQISLAEGLDKIYSLYSNIRLQTPEPDDENPVSIEFSSLDFEMRNTDFNEVTKITERLLRRIRIDVLTKARYELDNLSHSLPEWEGNFPAYSRYDLEIMYDNWLTDASRDHQLPFWVTSLAPYFYDKEDPEQDALHFQNALLVMPKGYNPICRVGQRENRYEKLLQNMENLGISKFSFSDYLLKISEREIPPSSGGSLDIDNIVQYFIGSKSIEDLQIFRRVSGDEITI